MIFVDSSAWFAVYSLRDVNHARASNAIGTFRESLVTSDYVVDETLTLLRARREDERALVFGNCVVDGGLASIVSITTEDFLASWQVFQKFHDKEWSFTDCTSYVLIQRLGIRRAFAFDEHFQQFGTVVVVP
jgi:predicted nucleic acid-binding protein